MPCPCHLFVYGTLKPGERAFADLCQPFAIATIPAQAKGRLYHLPLGYPAMTSEPGWTRGILITFADEMPLKAIDAFEEYYADRPGVSEYHRHCRPVFDLSKKKLGSAWVYTMEHERVVSLGGLWLPGGCWTESSVSPPWP